MPKHKQGVVSVDKIMGAGRERSDADREHEARRAGGVFAHTLVGQAQHCQPGPASRKPSSDPDGPE